MRADSSDWARCAVCVRETETDGRKRARLSQATTERVDGDVQDQSQGARLTEEENFLNMFEFDLTQQDTDVSGSDTVSCRSRDERVVEQRRTRLRLLWDSSRSNHHNHPLVRAPARLFYEASRRIGVVQPWDALPRTLRQQRWSPVNVPLMWEAAGEFHTGPVVDWLSRVCRKFRSRFICSRTQCQQMMQSESDGQHCGPFSDLGT